MQSVPSLIRFKNNEVLAAQTGNADRREKPISETLSATDSTKPSGGSGGDIVAALAAKLSAPIPARPTIESNTDAQLSMRLLLQFHPAAQGTEV